LKHSFFLFYCLAFTQKNIIKYYFFQAQATYFSFGILYISLKRLNKHICQQKYITIIKLSKCPQNLFKESLNLRVQISEVPCFKKVRIKESLNLQVTRSNVSKISGLRSPRSGQERCWMLDGRSSWSLEESRCVVGVVRRMCVCAATELVDGRLHSFNMNL